MNNKVPQEYYFITPPQDVSWNRGAQASELKAYGTNTPFLNYGMTKMRKLQLGNAMIEGFSDGKEVEIDVTNLEACMKMQLDSGSGYAAPYCWFVFAGQKSYGVFIVTQVRIKEAMRDAQGKATRAFADVTLQEVPSYQVSQGNDITSQAFTGKLSEKAEKGLLALNQDAKVAGAKTPGAAGAAASATGAADGSGATDNLPPADLTERQR